MTSTTLDKTQSTSKASPLDFRTWSQRTASLVAGFGLAAMAVVMSVGWFGLIVPLIDHTNAEATATAITAAPLAFLGGVLAIAIVILLDFVVAAAWYALFKPVNRTLSAMAAWVRVVYSVLFAVAAAQLVNAFTLLDAPARALAAVESYNLIWVASLGLFGIHLLLIAYLIVRADFIASVFGVLLGIAGLCYIVDAIGVLFGLGLPVLFGSFGFVGEVAIIFWLFIKGRTLTR
ncbi:DUF4386 domain-containing protein [Microbacterium deminutum]|uniref:DUF4386 domain-containing protein n=1 Tax=Microbacterium deminutum TaxID=344164 RepID=A0ABP5BWN8_9MICO